MYIRYLIGILCVLYINAVVAGVYENFVKKIVNYDELDENDKMIAFLWKDFNINSSEKIQKVIIFISTEKNSLGKWTGVWGSSTSVAPNYSTITEDMSKAFTTKTGKIIWELDSNTSGIIQYDGELKWGIWYIDCKVFTIDKIVAITDAYKGGYPDDKDDVEEKAEKISAGVYKAYVGRTYVYSDLGTDKMLPINWSQFDIPKTEIITSIKITLSTTKDKLGVWQGAFGSQTNIAPDYWFITPDMKKILSGTTGSITWKVTPEEAKAIQSQNDGQLKFGVWWIDCGTFTIEACTVITDAAPKGEDNDEQEEKDDDKKNNEEENNNSGSDNTFTIIILIVLSAIALGIIIFAIFKEFNCLKHITSTEINFLSKK